MKKLFGLLLLFAIASFLAAQTPTSSANTTGPDSTKLEVLSAPKAYFPMNLDPKNLDPEVKVKLNVNEKGEVDNAEFLLGDASIQEEAVSTALRWKFKPFIRNGQPIPVNTTITLHFLPFPSIVRVSQSVLEGLIVKKVPPTYPPLARAARIQGSVVLHVLIAADGNIKDVSPITGHPMLLPAAIDAVKQWKFRPYQLNGNPMQVDSQITINFTLSIR